MDGWMDGRTDGRFDFNMPPEVPSGRSSFGGIKRLSSACAFGNLISLFFSYIQAMNLGYLKSEK